ncbi:photosynthetic NDH subunit of subcomplex B 5, chloroplastic [Morus notabilis]|uniref:photosynthetic NDH subunit of subcomplex B 5, chloroplastic n=1 Tax=Morus notabilis TaxID=981085 RepID=UPI000CED64D5|nr:photosynthetic NDH subunit of subcomplex B 5, chloroplastic [Morus notabilis]
MKPLGMAVRSSPIPLLSSSSSSITKIFSKKSESRVRVLNQKPSSLGFTANSRLVGEILGRNRRSSSLARLNAAGFAEVEPDLNEDPVDRWATNSISEEDFVYGVYDGHHTYHEGEDKGNFWELLAEEYASVDPPTGFQGLISWLFPPAIAAGMYFHVPAEYLFIGAGLFTVVFCIIEMDKPDQPHNFEPQIYNMERGTRDKLIADYNTMDIWDFNEKYGDLWDFTIKQENITKRDE